MNFTNRTIQYPEHVYELAIIENRKFDIMCYAKEYAEKLGGDELKIRSSNIETVYNLYHEFIHTYEISDDELNLMEMLDMFEYCLR